MRAVESMTGGGCLWCSSECGLFGYYVSIMIDDKLSSLIEGYLNGFLPY